MILQTQKIYYSKQVQHKEVEKTEKDKGGFRKLKQEQRMWKGSKDKEREKKKIGKKGAFSKKCRSRLKLSLMPGRSVTHT